MATFWMVFVEGASSPAKQHETVESAQMEAERLARANIGRKVWVLESKHWTQASIQIIAGWDVA